ncbi:MAG TPA: hypothetical protein VFM63_09600 [Pyrinomonadaceae bacterium]|nr:hypothetical protein [Pyrinomonadaceae bacterium]
MGAKTCMLVYADGNVADALKTNPSLDREASAALARKLFPSEKLQPLEDGSLAFTSPPSDEIRVGCFPGVAIVAAEEFATEPADLPSNFLAEGDGKNMYLHCMHSVVDMMVFGVWTKGELTRSLSMAPDSGMNEFGPRLPFEEPYWAGERPVDLDDEDSDYPLPFHPLEMGESALLEFFGYQLEGDSWEDGFDPETIPLLRFKRVQEKPWWKFW